jgi:transposase
LPEQVWLRFVENRPVSAVTTQHLNWCCAKLDNLGKKALIMIWHNASWHISKEVRTWLQTHHHTLKQQGKGVRIVAFYLPSKSPWLNRIEPHWVHGKRNLVEPNRLLTAQELAERICSYYGCDHEPHLAVTEKVA